MVDIYKNMCFVLSNMAISFYFIWNIQIVYKIFEFFFSNYFCSVWLTCRELTVERVILFLCSYLLCGVKLWKTTTCSKVLVILMKNLTWFQTRWQSYLKKLNHIWLTFSTRYTLYKNTVTLSVSVYTKIDCLLSCILSTFPSIPMFKKVQHGTNQLQLLHIVYEIELLQLFSRQK